MTRGDKTFLEQFESLAKVQKIARGDYLFRQSERCNNLFVIRQGLVKASYTTFDGRELVKSFIREGQCIASMHTIAANEPSPFGAVALEPCDILAVSGLDLQRLAEHSHAFALTLNQLFMEVAMKKERREYEFLCLSAEQRYKLLIQREPALLSRLTQSDIARHLGITPVALSRIRTRMSSGSKAVAPL